MFILDDILLSPLKSFMMIANKIHEAASEEMAAEARELTQRLQGLYHRLEAGEITEDEFDDLEAEIIDRLDELEGLVDDESEEVEEEGFTVTLLDDAIAESEAEHEEDTDR